MNWARFFFLFFLVPNLIYAAYHAKDYQKDSEKIASEWKRHNKLIQQFNGYELEGREQNIALITESIACCERAADLCNYILKRISEKSKSERVYWEEEKGKVKQNKSNLDIEIENLRTLINNTFRDVAFSKASSLYQEAGKRAAEGLLKSQNCVRHLNNVEEVIATLNEVSRLYEEAHVLACDALNLISLYPDEESKSVLRRAIEHYQAAANLHKKEAVDWPASIAAQKNALKEQLATLQEDGKFFTEKGLKCSAYELQKQAAAVLEQLIESSIPEEAEAFQEELAQLKGEILAFESEAERSCLIGITSCFSKEEFAAREKERREFFFKDGSAFNPEMLFQNILPINSFPLVLPLDGGAVKEVDNFVLYTEQFYRFLIQCDNPISELVVTVYKEGEQVHEEIIALPLKNTPSWERYLIVDGMTFIPGTKLKSDFGLDLRLSFVCNPQESNSSMVIAQRCSVPGYQFSFSLKNGKTSLYACNFLKPPPWQLGCLCKPVLSKAERPFNKKDAVLPPPFKNEPGKQLEGSFPLLDQLVDQLKGDPLALAAYVYNEIELDNRFPYQEGGIFHALGIQRNACMTFLEKRGSPWEQCQLLIYLLRKAGYQALYGMATTCSLPKAFLEKMLLTKLPLAQTNGLVNYPWILFFDGKVWISLFPWMKEMHVHEGYDLYNLMPDEYASADRWILRYLKEDEKILKHIALSDKDDTLGVLFPRFVEEQLKSKGLSLFDVGVHRTQIKKQFSSWSDFPRPLAIQGTPEVLDVLDKDSALFAKAKVEIFPHEDPQKKISQTFPLVDLSWNAVPLRFTSCEGSRQRFHVHFIGEQEERLLELDESDRIIDITIRYETSSGPNTIHSTKTLSLAKGTEATLCFHLGGANSQVTSQFYQQFSLEQEETKRLHALLAFVGAAYFEKCGRAEKMLSQLHKTPSVVDFAFGLTKLMREKEDLKAPQVDMAWYFSPLPPLDSTFPQQEIYSAIRALESLVMVDTSSNEHQILFDVFGVKEAVSTVKLLQLANRQQQKKGLSEPGFLSLTSFNMAAAEEAPEVAKDLHFPQLKELDISHLKAVSCGQWDFTKKTLAQGMEFDSYAYAYMTPGLTFSQDRSYQEIGTLIFHPLVLAGLISSHHLVLHGGLGAPLPSYYFAPSAIHSWQLIPSSHSNTSSYTLYVPPDSGLISSSSSFLPEKSPFLPGTSLWNADVRLENKSFLSRVGDPVDVVTGAFYIDEVDLVLPGPFALEIRRNYNSQNPLIGDLGVGWKLSLNPSLIEQDGKLYAAEADGSIIVYRYHHGTSRWEVFPEDNPDLYFLGQSANPFHAYIENDVLYGSDGSKRIFEDGLLREWINNRGNVLTFFYNGNKLSRIESSNGDFCGLLYNHEGKIAEIYAKDGRRISYSYNFQGDLVKVTLPNSATIVYEYDRAHRIIRETKPHGKILENIYEEGKVKEQRSPMGPGQTMVTTATFNYEDGHSLVTDAKQGKTIYKIFQNQIYKIIDPLGCETLQAWFIDAESWFNPIAEKISKSKEREGAPRCLKASTDKRGLTTDYLYDSRGNPIEIRLKGEDLTGNGQSVIAKKLTYNDRDLCTQEEVLDQKVITTYDATFPYLPKRIETYSGNSLISYVDLEYNSQGLIEKEDVSSSVTLWKYDLRGFPIQKTELTGTDDPDSVTTYSYNNQGQCIECASADSIQQNSYDIMGNQIESKIFSLSGTLLFATYTGYDLNNQPIWKQTANPNHTLYLDYAASGLIKASRQVLNSSQSVAYTLYEYDVCGHLIEEVDPRGYCTYREYDALGRITNETKEGLSTFFTYEPGGLPETITSSSGAKITRLYTTNGLLKEETYPDGTKSQVCYDFLGRPIQETKNGISWEITYDDPHHRAICTNMATKTSEIREFDARGNLIRFTDTAGYISEKTYDGLNRIKTDTTPSGQQTRWNYQGDLVVSTLPNKETATHRYEGGHIAESQVTDARGVLIAHSSFHYDPETDVQQTTQGEEVTTTWMNALGLPLRVQKASSVITYDYDSQGNCIAITDADGRIISHTFDGLRRITQKGLPDGSFIKYVYDLDSHLSEYHLPNGTVWQAAYDTMGRKVFEELQTERQSSLYWEYVYENGYLKEAKDPMGRTHAYFYDLDGRLSQETLNGGSCTYTYDPRGLIATAEQIIDGNSNDEHSLVERSYDSDGRLFLESVYLNSHLVQRTKQTWNTTCRSLQIDDHIRNFIYQNNRLVSVLTHDVDLSYVYDLSGSLKLKSSPWTTTVINYNSFGLPEDVQTRLPDGLYQESLEWYPSAKLFSYSSPMQQKKFTYTCRGYLQSEGTEEYEFDFGGSANGTRTAAPAWTIPQNGLDAFGKILTEFIDETQSATTYNPMGEVITHGQNNLEWDPWGRLIKVSSEAAIWEASYDAFGRRLQTRYTSLGNSTITQTSFYDPEEEFQEIGVKYKDKTFWKIYGPSSCDAITDETGASVILVHNALDHLIGVVSRQGTLYNKQLPSSYGPQSTTPFILSDLLSYAQALTWHSQAQDPTGLIWMGKRYYDPRSGRFLSPDPIGYPACLDLYAYAGGDPVNYIDPDGRFFSPAYQLIKPTILKVGSVLSTAWHSPHTQGIWKAGSGFLEASVGAALAPTPFAPFGIALFAHGADRFSSGAYLATTGRQMPTLTSQLLQKAGISQGRADFWDDNINFAGTLGAGGIVYKLGRGAAALHNCRLPPASPIAESGGWVLPKKGGAFINNRWYSEHALERMAPRTPQVMADLEKRFLGRSQAVSQKLGPREFRNWRLANAPNPRGVPPSVVEAEIAHPGSTGVQVILNENGQVITVIPGGQ